MTRLEQEISHRIIACEFVTNVNGEFCFQPENVAKAAAEVAKRYIEKAFDAGVDATDGGEILISRSQWLRENGILESQPLDKGPRSGPGSGRG